jgi:hypothetical protein
LAVSTCLKMFGATIDARTAMITTTTRTSISVKADRRRRVERIARAGEDVTGVGERAGSGRSDA